MNLSRKLLTTLLCSRASQLPVRSIDCCMKCIHSRGKQSQIHFHADHVIPAANCWLTARIHLTTYSQVAFFHSTSAENVDLRASHCIVFEDFKNAVENDEVQVIDVRSPVEVKTGHIPAKRFANIPLEELDEALSDLTNAEFKMKYGIVKPEKAAKDIIFSCNIGGHSSQAVKIAHDAGFSGARHFPGGLAEWIKRIHELRKASKYQTRT